MSVGSPEGLPDKCIPLENRLLAFLRGQVRMEEKVELGDFEVKDEENNKERGAAA